MTPGRRSAFASGRVAAARKLLRRRSVAARGRDPRRGAAGAELARGRRPVREVFVTGPAAERHRELLAGLAEAGAGSPGHRRGGRGAVRDGHPAGARRRRAGCPPPRLASRCPAAPRLVAVLVEARDPGNPGTIVRTADAAGADAVILAGDSVDPFGRARPSGPRPAASSRSRSSTPCSHRPSCEHLAARGLRLLAADGHAAPRSRSSLATRRTRRGPTAWVFGNEAHGLPSGDRLRHPFGRNCRCGYRCTVQRNR